jgi:hypothetical protein
VWFRLDDSSIEMVPRPSCNDALNRFDVLARLAGCAPIPASSGQTIGYRLDRSGDRQLTRALHMILINRRRWHAPINAMT